MGRLAEGRILGGENRPVDVNGLIPSGGEVISTGTGGAATLAIERGFWEGLCRF